MSRVLSSRPVRSFTRPLRTRLGNHTTRVARAEIDPLRQTVVALTKRVDEQSQELARMRSQVARLAKEQEAAGSRASELAGRFEALRYRYAALVETSSLGVAGSGVEVA